MKSILRRELVDIGQVIQNGVVFDLKNWQGGAVDAEHIPEAVTRLFALFEKKRIAYVLVGGVALLQYAKGRNTQDIHFILDKSAVESVSEWEVTGRDEYFARASYEGLRVDLLLTTHPLFAHVRKAYSAIRPFQDREIPCATVEGLLLLKLFALPSLYRRGDLDKVALYESDVLMLLSRSKTPADSLFAELKPHLSDSDLGEVRTIVGELQERIERVERGRDKL
jgi:hypothetical protein